MTASVQQIKDLAERYRDNENFGPVARPVADILEAAADYYGNGATAEYHDVVDSLDSVIDLLRHSRQEIDPNGGDGLLSEDQILERLGELIDENIATCARGDIVRDAHLVELGFVEGHCVQLQELVKEEWNVALDCVVADSIGSVVAEILYEIQVNDGQS